MRGLLPPELWTGLAVGAVIALPLGLLSRWIPWFGGQLGLFGLGAAIAALFRVQLEPPLAVALGAALFVLVGSMCGRRKLTLLAVPVTVVGSVLIADYSDGSTWVAVVVGSMAGIGALAVGDFDQRSPLRETGPLLALVSAAGIFLAIPDTERASGVLGALIPITAAAFVVPRPGLGPGGSGLLALLVWVVASGGHSRPAAVIGGLAAVGLLLLEPVLRTLVRRRPLSGRPPTLRLALGAHIAFVIVVTRSAAQFGNLVVAVTFVVLATAAMAALYERRLVVVSDGRS